MAQNPLICFAPDEPEAVPLAELKQHLVLFVPSPPGPKTARRVLDLYFQTWGDRFVRYGSTAFGSREHDWNADTREAFFANVLPKLRTHVDWGYSFWDGRKTDSWTVMFHGYGACTDAGKSSVYRFEFDWQVDSDRLSRFAGELVDTVGCLSGYAGYAFQGRPRGWVARSSFNQVFAWAQRYWGVDAQDLDVTVSYMTDAYKCVNWMTVIGRALAERNPEAVERATRAGYRYHERSGGHLFQASERPMLGDRHRLESLPGYMDIAAALEPLQVRNHAPFGDGTGSRWTEGSTNAWLRRFTEPDRVRG